MKIYAELDLNYVKFEIPSLFHPDMPRMVESNEVTFYELTSTAHRLIVPFLQRNYVWKSEHYSQL